MEDEHCDIELSEDEKKVMMMTVAKKYFGSEYDRGPINYNITQNKSVENTRFDNEEYFYETGELCKEDRIKMLTIVIQEYLTNGNTIPESNSACLDNNSDLSHKDRSMLLNIVNKIKSQAIIEGGRSEEANIISNEDTNCTFKVSNTCNDQNINEEPEKVTHNQDGAVSEIFTDQNNDLNHDNEKSPNLHDDQIPDRSSRTISKQDRDSIVNLLNSSNGGILNEQAQNMFDLPTRPNSKQSSPVRNVKLKVTKNLADENRKAPDNNPIITKRHLYHDSTQTSLINIGKHDKKINFQGMDEFPNNDVGSTHQLENAKNQFLGFFEQKKSVETNNSVENIEKRKFNEMFKIDDKTISCSNNNKESYHYRSHRVSDMFIDKCIIEEQYFNLSKYKTPMNDAQGPYYIDKDDVSVDIYQDGLNDGWNPTQVVFELCSQCQWQPPVFVQHSYVIGRGFHIGVSVKECHFVPITYGANKKVAKHYASSFFLNFLGFKFRFNNNQQLTRYSTPLYNNYDCKKNTFVQSNDVIEHTNHRENNQIKKPYKSNDYINKSENYNSRRSHVLYDEGHSSKHKEHYSKNCMIKTNRSQYSSSHETKATPYHNRPYKSIFTRVIHEIISIKKDQETHTRAKDERSHSKFRNNMNFNEENYDKKDNIKRKRNELNIRDPSTSSRCYNQDFNNRKFFLKEDKMKRDSSSSSISSN